MREIRYRPRKLERAVDNYFLGISRLVPVTESVDSGERDEKGKAVMKTVPVCNQRGEQVCRLEYVIPPNVGDLLLHLGIGRRTWSELCDPDRSPELARVAEYALERLQAYLERESLTREGKDLKGILFNLENNYGYKEKVEISGGVEAYLQRLADEGGGKSL